MHFLSRLLPRSITGQMIAILSLSFAALLIAFTFDELMDENDDLIAWANSQRTLGRIETMKPILDNLPAEHRDTFFDLASTCLSGHAITRGPFERYGTSQETEQLRDRISNMFRMPKESVRVGYALVHPGDFSFGRCRREKEELPTDGIIISIKLNSGEWFHKEVHEHLHFWYVTEWILRTSALFIFIGGVTIFFIRRLTRPMDQLATAAQQFGQGLQVSKLKEEGPADVKRTIEAFNAMQQQVTDEIKKRTDTLAAISHDVRTPLTALRIKAELIEEEETKQDLITSIERMEKITASALEFLKGESRGEPLRETDINALLESECQDFEEMGNTVQFEQAGHILHSCRPEALARAIRNLIENAIKYGGGAYVTAKQSHSGVSIIIADTGPGIPEDKIALALEPFERLSKARESNKGGFGLGLSVAKAIAEGHDGQLVLERNMPTGLIATIKLPAPTI